MKMHIEIDIDASETIMDTIMRGTFEVHKDGNGHKLKVGDVVIPRRKCKVKFEEPQKGK